ncbi:glutathione S-transferase [Cladochytrium replicatum]|nr:glutathione S-transferase [Cladochytrium replicatum]
MSSVSETTLYGYWRSSTSWRVRLALNLKGADFKTVPVNLLEQEQLGPEYIQKNPGACVPTLELKLTSGETRYVTQSPAILELLEEIYPDPPLLPSDPFARAEVRAIVCLIACDTSPVQNLKVLAKAAEVAGATGDDAVAIKNEWGAYWISRGLASVEQALKPISGKYCYKDTVTLADVCLIPQVSNALRFGIDVSKYPTIARIADNLRELEAFQKSEPAKQPGAIQ